MNHDVRKLQDLLKELPAVMLLTRGRDKEIHARPMAIAELDGDCVMWFISAKDCEKTRQIENDPLVDVICQGEAGVYASITGTAEPLVDPAQVRRLWKDPYNAWFPAGRDDPSLTLIRVDPLQAVYWDSHGSRLIRFDASGVPGGRELEAPPA